MEIAIFGAGYVGCVCAACFAQLGHKVWLVEVVQAKLNLLVQGRSPVVEPGLEPLLSAHVQSGAIVPVGDAALALEHARIAFICVGTPSRADGMAETKYIKRVVREIGQAITERVNDILIVLRSTVPYAQIEDEVMPEIDDRINSRKRINAAVAVNPEFLREGSAVSDFLNPPFIVVGTLEKKVADELRQLYSGIDAPFRVVSPGTASLLKYACNAFHGVKVAFANELASLASAFGAEPVQVMELFCEDRVLNISPAYLRPGFAYGGSCLPKDISSLNRLADLHGRKTPVLSSVPESNNIMIEQALQALIDQDVRSVSLIGLSFKQGTDDLRSSPLVELGERLIGKGIELSIFDPDIRFEDLHGQNLEYMEAHLSHLSQLLVSTLAELATSDFTVVGKSIVSVSELEEHAVDRIRILDLTRQMRVEHQSGGHARVYQLDGRGLREIAGDVLATNE